jgi:hypothetical protein
VSRADALSRSLALPPTASQQQFRSACSVE